MARHKVEICGVNTASLKVLNNDEMLELFKKYNEGDMLAKEELINGNLKLVLSILKKYNNRCDNMDDLFQVGCIGLIKAIDNFDLNFEVKFSTYAVPMILGEIKRYLRDNSSLRVSRSVKDIAYKTLKLKEELTDVNGREPSLKEISEILGVTEYEVANALDSLREPVSMYEPIYNDGGDTIYLFDQLSSDRDEYSLDIKIALDKAMKKLKPREQYILDERFVIGRTQMEIASELGISQAQISRIEKNAINNIKKLIK
jgi:RNA polymerase sporulation-specific sigma factor